jgi:catechol 2,3-dioxygenase-like lactoylglutathione lyase family enzyme
MLMNNLFHIAIKSPNIEATREFYCDVLGMTLAERPQMAFPGYWIKSPLPDGIALFHIYGGDAALEDDGSMSSGGGVIDHVSVSCQGYYEIRERLEQRQLGYRENVIPAIRLWQLFVYDPSGVLLELTFSQDAENAEPPEFPDEKRYKPRERFFNPQSYKNFGS